MFIDYFPLQGASRHARIRIQYPTQHNSRVHSFTLPNLPLVYFLFIYLFFFFLGGLSLTHQNAEQLFLHTRHTNYQTTLDE